MHHKRSGFSSCQLIDGEKEISLPDAMRTELRKLGRFRVPSDSTASSDTIPRADQNHTDVQDDMWPQVDRYAGYLSRAESSASSGGTKTSSVE
eukprot:4672671-Amphidinium_carterae.1